MYGGRTEGVETDGEGGVGSEPGRGFCAFSWS